MKKIELKPTILGLEKEGTRFIDPITNSRFQCQSCGSLHNYEIVSRAQVFFIPIVERHLSAENFSQSLAKLYKTRRRNF